MKMLLFVFLIYYSITFSLLIIASYSPLWKRYRVPVKTLTSLGFLSVAIYSFACGAQHALPIWMIAAFVLYLIGDVFLGITDNKESMQYFPHGLIAFALGHIAFVAALSTVVAFSPLELIIPAVSVISTVMVSRTNWINLGHFALPCFIYTFIVSWLFSKTFFVFFALGMDLGPLLLALGGALFFLSDSIILILYFFKKKFKLTVFLNLFTYYAGMACLALALFHV